MTAWVLLLVVEVVVLMVLVLLLWMNDVVICYHMLQHCYPTLLRGNSILLLLFLSLDLVVAHGNQVLGQVRSASIYIVDGAAHDQHAVHHRVGKDPSASVLLQLINVILLIVIVISLFCHYYNHTA
jgi:hypothetical protein